MTLAQIGLLIQGGTVAMVPGHMVAMVSGHMVAMVPGHMMHRSTAGIAGFEQGNWNVLGLGAQGTPLLRWAQLHFVS